MAREHWRVSELLAIGWTPAHIVRLLDQRPDIRLDGELAYSAARVAIAEAKSPRLRAAIVHHREPPPGVWLHTLGAVADANDISEARAKRRIGEPVTYRLRKTGQGYWAAYTAEQVEAAGFIVPVRPEGRSR